MLDPLEMVDLLKKSEHTIQTAILAIKFDEEAAKKWLATGAQPTDTVAKLLKAAGIEK